MVALVTACRVGFEDRPDGAPPPPPPPPEIDASIPPPDVPPPPPPPTVLACGAPKRFSMVKAPSTLAATATADGYNVVTSDGVDVRGTAYKFVDDALVAERGDVPLFTGATGETGEITTIANGAGSLLAVTHGPSPLFPGPTYDRTSLVPLDAQLKAGLPTRHDAWVSGIGGLARNDAGLVAFLGTVVPSSEIDIRIVGPDGAPAGPAHAVTTDGLSPSVVPAGDDFIVVWSAYLDPAYRVYASRHAMTNESFVTKVQPTIVSFDTMGSALNARGAYSAATGTSLFVWMQKDGTGDHIWTSLRDRDLNEIGTPKELGPGTQPLVVAGKDDFLVAWRIDAVRLAAMRVTPTGAVQAVPIEGTARDAIAQDLVVRAGQPALVWVEREDSGGATVRFDPLCNP